MKISFLILTSIFLLFSNLYAEEETEEDYFGFFLETRSIYSTGVSDSNLNNRTKAALEFTPEYFTVSAYLQRYFNYQLANGSGVYENRSFNEAGLSLDIYVAEVLNLTGEYSYAEDFIDLSKNYYYGSVELVLDPVSLSADYSCETFKYEIDYVEIETDKKDYSAGIDISFSDSFSADLSYSHSNLYFNVLGYNYIKDLGRIGFIVIPGESFFLLAGFSAGKDSDDYYIYGADCGFSYKISSMLRFSFSYNYSYYDPASELETDTAAARAGGPGGGSNSSQASGVEGNPYLSADQIGEPYNSQSFSAGVKLSF